MKWTYIRWGLRALAAAVGAAAAVSPPGIVTTILIAAAAGIGTLTVDLPKDKEK